MHAPIKTLDTNINIVQIIVKSNRLLERDDISNS